MTKSENKIIEQVGRLKVNLNKKIDDVIIRIIKFDVLFLLSTIIVFALLVKLKFIRLFSRTNLSSIVEFLTSRFWPPETSSVVQENIRLALWETIQMAFIGHVFCFINESPCGSFSFQKPHP